MKELVPSRRPLKLDVAVEVDLGRPTGQCRAIPVELGGGGRAVLAIYCADFDVDPWVEMFFFPSDTLKFALFDEKGQVLWKRDLGRAVVPGMWFCPVFPFDLDRDGADEIWFVNNLDPDHPLGLSHYRLERVDALSGKATGQWAWPDLGGAQSLSHIFRNFIVGGFVRGEPVLVTCQGTYEGMFFQAFDRGMEPRWRTSVDKSAPGARGSHMCPVVDINRDGVDELMWGERCIELDRGTELFCADRDEWRGHSDVAQPVLDRESGRWFLYTCRESDQKAAPRVALYDDTGRRVWGAVDYGHIDMGWVARIGPGARPVASAIRISTKTCGPDGRHHKDCEEFTFDAMTGRPVELPFATYRTEPVDLNGDGFHELVRGIPGSDGEVLGSDGKVLGSVGDPICMASKFFDRPGEQVLTYSPQGVVRVWRDANAEDSDAAKERYANPFYRATQRLSASGSNVRALGGL